MTQTPQKIEIRFQPQEWVNDYAVDAGRARDYDVTKAARTDIDLRWALIEIAKVGADIDTVETPIFEALRKHHDDHFEGPFYVRLVLDGTEADDPMDEESVEALRTWLEQNPFTKKGLPSGVRRITVAQLLAQYQAEGTTPYAIVSEATGGYAAIEGEVYETSDGEGFVHVEVDLGVLRLALDQDAEPILVADTRAAAMQLKG